MTVKGVKVRKFLFNISWRFKVMEEKTSGGGTDSPYPGMDRVKTMVKTITSIKYNDFIALKQGGLILFLMLCKMNKN